MSKYERWLKIVLWVFGAPCVVAFFPFVMPRSWMAVTHEWLGMGALPDKPIVGYLARTASGLFGLYGCVLLLLASDVQRYSRVIRLQAVLVIVLSGAGAVFGFRAGMPAWWMIWDLTSCWFCCGVMLWLQRRMELSSPLAGQAKPFNHVLSQ